MTSGRQSVREGGCVGVDPTGALNPRDDDAHRRATLRPSRDVSSRTRRVKIRSFWMAKDEADINA